jgi:lia operon protein LiaG
MKKLLIILAIIAAVSFIIAFSLFYSTGGLKPISSAINDISQYEEIDASGVESIHVSTVDTPVKISTYDGSKIKADFTGKIKTNISGRLPELKIRRINEELKIEIIYPTVVSFGFFDISDLNLEVRIPEEITGSININTTSAKVNAEDMKTKDFSVESVSGAIDLKNIESEYIEIKNTSGKCMLSNALGKIYVNTVSGGVSIINNKLINDIEVSTISGAVEARIPADSSFNFNLSSVSGKIENNFKPDKTYTDRQSIKGTVRSGDYEINISTTSGAIMLSNN